MTITENPQSAQPDANAPAAAQEGGAQVKPAAPAQGEKSSRRQTEGAPAGAAEGEDAGGERRRGRRGGRGVRVDGNLEKAIRQFRKRIERQGLFRELRKRRFYEKPSERRKRKQREAEKRRRKKTRRD